MPPRHCRAQSPQRLLAAPSKLPASSSLEAVGVSRPSLAHCHLPRLLDSALLNLLPGGLAGCLPHWACVSCVPLGGLWLEWHLKLSLR